MRGAPAAREKLDHDAAPVVPGRDRGKGRRPAQLDVVDAGGCDHNALLSVVAAWLTAEEHQRVALDGRRAHEPGPRIAVPRDGVAHRRRDWPR
jgi:hypothetical protein